MNLIVKNFFEREKKNGVSLETLPNGIRYLTDQCVRFNRIHEIYKPLTDEQIDTLQLDVNQAQLTDFVFPEWYRDFLKTTNGCNIYFGCISLYGEQTPLVWSEKYNAYIKALLERTNPNWMAPYNLRDIDIKFDEVSKKRWLAIGTYHFDGTQIVWDYKTQKLIAMYSLPVTISIKALKKMSEADYENLICAQWDSFDDFFVQETKRLNNVITRYGVDKEKGFLSWEKTLPIGHKDYQD